jgi:hypothetical protein
MNQLKSEMNITANNYVSTYITENRTRNDTNHR